MSTPSSTISFATLLLLANLTPLTFAQSLVNPTTAAPSATPLNTAFGYEYAGCWNETTGFRNNDGVRALAEDGKFSANNSMTTSDCLEFCSQGIGEDGSAMQFAGLEYGRECYCSPYLSALSERLPDSRCIYSCVGNSSQVCGGQLAFTLYNLTASSDSKTGIAWSRFDGAAGYGTLTVITLIIAAVL